MFKSCAKIVETQREKHVHTFPQHPPYCPEFCVHTQILNTFPSVMLIPITVKPHVLHSPKNQNNRGEM